jgi:hypothetical protein
MSISIEMVGTRENTHICSGNSAKPNVAAIFNDWVAGAAQVHVHASAAVHAELATGHHNDAIFDAGYMCWPINLATYQQALVDILHSETGIWFAVCSGYGHINDAMVQRCNRCRYGRCGA